MRSVLGHNVVRRRHLSMDGLRPNLAFLQVQRDPWNRHSAGTDHQSAMVIRSGTNNTNAALGVGVAERAQANTGAGVFVTTSSSDLRSVASKCSTRLRVARTLAAPAFVPNRDYEPRGFNVEENEEGRFQLEIRTADDYASRTLAMWRQCLHRPTIDCSRSTIPTIARRPTLALKSQPRPRSPMELCSRLTVAAQPW